VTRSVVVLLLKCVVMGGGQQVHVATVESEVEGYKQISEAATLPMAEKKGKSSKEKKEKEEKVEKEKKPPKEKKTKTVTVVEGPGPQDRPGPGPVTLPEEFPLPPPEDTLLNLIVLNR